MRQDAPVKALECTPMVWRAEVTMVETRAGVGDDPRATGAPDQLGEERGADSTLLAGVAIAVGTGPGSGHVHEEA